MPGAATVHDLRFIRPEEFIEELRLDLAAGGVEDRIVRLAQFEQQATQGEIEPRRGYDTRAALGWHVVWIECSYVSSRHQLVKLSRRVGCRWLGEDSQRLGRPTSTGAEASAEVELRAKEVYRNLRRPLEEMRTPEGERLDLRGGGLYVEEGPWAAPPEAVIETPAPEACATCKAEIYFANNQWRHKSSGRAEVLEEGDCGGCDGTGEQGPRRRRCAHCGGSGRALNALHHYADPELEDLKILA